MRHEVIADLGCSAVGLAQILEVANRKIYQLTGVWPPKRASMASYTFRSGSPIWGQICQ
jgi:hypothetical protein